MAAATQTGIQGITLVMDPAAGAGAGLARGTIIVRIMARVCAWAAGRAALARIAASTGNSIVTGRVDRVTAVAVLVMHPVHLLMNRVPRRSTRAIRAAGRVTGVVPRVMHQAHRLMVRAVPVMVAVVRVLRRTTVRVVVSESAGPGPRVAPACDATSRQQACAGSSTPAYLSWPTLHTIVTGLVLTLLE